MRKLWLLLACVFILAIPAAAQLETPIYEVTAGYSFVDFNESSVSGALHGWNFGFTRNFNDWFGITSDFSGAYGAQATLTPSAPGSTPFNAGFRVHNFLGGPRFSWRRFERVTPFAHALTGNSLFSFGGNPGAGFQAFSSNRYGLALGGGFDIHLNDKVSLRLLQADYLLTRAQGSTQHNLRYSGGLVWRFGEM